MNDFVTIKISDHPSELTIAKSYLEDLGIFCFIKDELISQVYPMASNAFGGAKLQVREEDQERAIQLLLEGGFVKKEDYAIPKSMLKLSKIYEKISSFFKRKE